MSDGRLLQEHALFTAVFLWDEAGRMQLFALSESYVLSALDSQLALSLICVLLPVKCPFNPCTTGMPPLSTARSGQFYFIDSRLLFQLCIVLYLSSPFLWSPCPCLPSFLPQWFLTERSLSSWTSVCYKILLFVVSFLLIPINFLYYLPLTIREQMLQLLLKNNGIKKIIK